MSKSSDRSRVWAFLVWQESALENWKILLSAEHIPACISPLHDKDIYTDLDKVYDSENGDEEHSFIESGKLFKKAHWHVILNYSGPKTLNQVKELTDKLRASRPIRVEDIGGYTRYLIHIDDKEKFQYNINEIVAFAGYDYKFYFELSKSQVYDCIESICRYCRDNHIVEFSDLIDFALEHKPKWFFVCMNVATVAITKYLNSCRYKREKFAYDKINPDTGEYDE